VDLGLFSRTITWASRTERPHRPQNVGHQRDICLAYVAPLYGVLRRLKVLWPGGGGGFVRQSELYNVTFLFSEHIIYVSLQIFFTKQGLIGFSFVILCPTMGGQH